MKYSTLTLLACSLCATASLMWTPSAAALKTATATPIATPTAGPWSTGAGQFGPLQAVSYPPGEHWIDLNQEGHYDAERWVVILEYSSFTVQAGAVLRFHNHDSGAPVVIRATGTVRIDGKLDLDGADGHRPDEPRSYAEPGPGGFRGGIGADPDSPPGNDIFYSRSAGFGPGGGGITDVLQIPGGVAGGSHASAGSRQGFFSSSLGGLYGTKDLKHLVGGSGGTAGDPAVVGSTFFADGTYGGGAGGGAILIGSDTSIILNGSITARGGIGYGTGPAFSGAGSGSGGAIRLAAPSVTWTASPGEAVLDASGAGCAGKTAGGDGRVRVEALNLTQNNYLPVIPAGSQVCELAEFLPLPAATIVLDAWLDPVTDEWIPATQDPHAELLGTVAPDLPIGVSGNVTLRVMTVGIPPGAPIRARVAGATGSSQDFDVQAQAPAGGDPFALTEIPVVVPTGMSAIQFLAQQ